jgi:hypothetical protein
MSHSPRNAVGVQRLTTAGEHDRTVLVPYADDPGNRVAALACRMVAAIGVNLQDRPHERLEVRDGHGPHTPNRRRQSDRSTRTTRAGLYHLAEELQPTDGGLRLANALLTRTMDRHRLPQTNGTRSTLRMIDWKTDTDPLDG